MFPKIFQFALIITSVIASGGCATQSPANRSQLAKVRTVAVTYAPVAPQTSTGNRVAGRVARHGAGFALGQLGFVGGIVGLAVDVVDISRPAREAKISSTALQLLGKTGTDPLALTAARTEKEIARRRIFSLANSNPDAVIDLELREVSLKSADNRDLLCRATLGVTARLHSRSGATLWQKDASATSGRVRLWRDYSEQPRLVRADFDTLAGFVSRQLFADFPAREKDPQ